MERIMIIDKFDKSDTIYSSTTPNTLEQNETLLSVLGRNLIIISENERFDDCTISRLIKQQNNI